MKTPAVVLATLVLAACQAGGPGADRTRAPAAIAPTATGDASPERPSDFVILGEATYRERIKTPPGARLDVELIDARSGAVLARTTVPDVAGPPMPFALRYDPARAPAAGRYALRATLVGPDGERWFATPAPVPVVPGEGTSVELLMHRAPVGSSSGGGLAAGAASAVHWECGDLGVMARRTGDALDLAANGARWRLQRRPDDGFADAAGTTFRSEGEVARLALRGEPARDCVPARQASPWNGALASGVDFRAVGNEPGWFVEIDRDAAPALRATLDYGERRLAATRVEPTPSGFSAVDADGARIEVAVERRACSDAMSGQRFEAAARLRVAGRTYEGCGAYLAD